MVTPSVDRFFDADTYLFLGGPADGQRRKLPVGATYYEVAERVEEPLGPYVARGPEDIRDLDIRIHRYRVVGLALEGIGLRAGPGAQVNVLVAEGMTAADMLQRLVAHYKPPAGGRG